MLTKEKIEDIINDKCSGCYHGEEINGAGIAAEAILAEMDEPLAVLADNKGYCISVIRRRKHNIHNPYNWRIVIITKNNTEKIDVEDVSYAAAEQAAREYLEALPDRK